ncbi:MAG: translocation/assembly module TamB domain-containing protein [Pseudomonadota bacterium]
MRVLALLFILLAPAAWAQSGQIERLIENQLSGDGRVVEVDGFAGALTAEATMEALRIFDDEGLWLELRDVRLNWNRGALLRGRLEVTELAAANLNVLRGPIPQDGVEVPEAEASGFRIPDLPVAIQIDRLAVEEIFLGAPLLGEEVRATAEISAALADGALAVTLDAARVDDRPGTAIIDLSYSPETEELGVELRVAEPAGGIVATALALPGLPSVGLDVEGAGPLDAFAADFVLATDGEERLGGQATLNEDGAAGRAFAVDLSGDIRPLLEPSNRAFFGPETLLTASGNAGADGALALEDLRLEAAQLLLTGSASLAGGAPQSIDLTGLLAREGRAAIPGTEVTLARSELSVAFDASVSEFWDLSLTTQDVNAGTVTVGSATITGRGQIVPGTVRPFAGDIQAVISGLDFPGDPALAEAVGAEAQLVTALSAEDGSFSFAGLELVLENGTANGSAVITPTDGRVALRAALTVDAPDISPFSAIAGRDLAGEVSANLDGDMEVPGGAIVFTLGGRTNGLDVGIEPVAGLVSPETTFGLGFARDENGTRIDDLVIENAELRATADGEVSSADGALDVTANLRDVGLLTDLVDGPVSLDVSLGDALGARRVEGALSAAFGLDATVSGPLSGPGAEVTLNGALHEVERFVPQLSGVAELVASVALEDVPTLAAELAVAPGIQATVNGPLAGEAQALDILAEIADLAAFAPPLPGPARLSARVSDFEAGPLIEADITATPGLTARVEGRPTQPGAVVTVRANANDLGFIVPLLEGPATVDAELRALTGDLDIAADLTATPGLSARITGQPLGPASRIDLAAEAASLGFLAPQLAGSASVTATLSDLTGAQQVEASVTSATGLSADVSGALSEALALRARVASLARFVPGLAGGATVSANVSDLQGTPDLRASATTDSGARIDLDAEAGLPGGAVRADASGTLPLAIANAFASGRSLEGTASFDLGLAGPPSLDAVSGTIRTAGARVFDPTLGLTLSPIDADIDLSGGQARLDASAALDGVPIRISGSAGLASPFAIDLGLRTVRLPVAYLDVLTSEVTADLQVEGSMQNQLAVGGLVRVEDVEIRIPDTGLGGATAIPSIRHEGAPRDVRETLARAGLRLDGREPGGGGGGPRIPLDVTVEAINQIFVRGRGLDAGFQGGLRITGTAATPIPAGQFNLTRGRLDFLGRRLDLDEGRITIAGTFLPRIDIAAVSQVEDITARIGLSGPVDAPELELSSSPELPEDEILARVLFGRGIETLSPLQVARLVSSLRQLSGAGGAGFLESARAGLGVDDLDLRTDAETGEAALAIGAELDEDVYTEVEVGSGGNTTLSLNFDLNETTTLRGSASSDGETGVGIFWQRDY